MNVMIAIVVQSKAPENIFTIPRFFMYTIVIHYTYVKRG